MSHQEIRAAAYITNKLESVFFVNDIQRSTSLIYNLELDYIANFSGDKDEEKIY
jgi:hypothetical protein